MIVNIFFTPVDFSELLKKKKKLGLLAQIT